MADKPKRGRTKSRPPITKKVRFEVFKRDDFTCQYCGNTPPAVVLEIDHIDPVSKGGDGDINNLLTSCFDCNRGKSNTPLARITPALSENLEVLKQKEEQLKEYRKFVSAAKRRMTRDVGKIGDLFSAAYEGYELTDSFKKTSIKMFLDKLPFHEVEESMEIATSKIEDRNACLQYFCGICWNKIKARRGPA